LIVLIVLIVNEEIDVNSDLCNYLQNSKAGNEKEGVPTKSHANEKIRNHERRKARLANWLFCLTQDEHKINSTQECFLQERHKKNEQH